MHPRVYNILPIEHRVQGMQFVLYMDGLLHYKLKNKSYNLTEKNKYCTGGKFKYIQNITYSL